MWDADGPAKMIVNDLIDEVILGVAFEIHRSVKLGLDKLAEGINVEPEVTFGNNGVPSTSNGDADSDHSGIEVFGAINMKKQMGCVCPNCNRTLAATRFAPHLEKCVGMGRNSSRLASKRIAINAAVTQASTSSSTLTHSDDDDEWTLSSDRKRKRNTTREKSSHRTKKGRSNGDGGSAGSGSLPASPAGTPPETHNNKSNVICGVISEHTGRTCTRSIKCPKHAHLRKNTSSSGCTEEVESVDVDSVEDDSTNSRSWVDHPITPSPADSTSNSSGTSLKQHKGSSASKGKKRNHAKGKLPMTSAFLY